MSSTRFFIQLPVQFPDKSVRRRYYDCMPIVFICHEEKYATSIASAVLSAFATWNVPGVEEEWKDDELLKLNADPTLGSIRRKLYVFVRPETGQKTITTDYGHDILPLLQNPHNAHVPFRRVETLAQALVFIMTKGDTQRLRSLGMEWAERRSSPRFQSNKNPNADAAGTAIPPHNSASASVPVSASGELPSGRRAPRCTKCRKPMKGHSKSLCRKQMSSSLESAVARLSLNDGHDQTGDQPPCIVDTVPSDEAHCFILSSEDIERVDAAILAQGLKSRTVDLTETKSGEVAYIVAKTTGPLEALATEVINTNGGANVGWLRVSSAAAIGAISAWAGLAYL